MSSPYRKQKRYHFWKSVINTDPDTIIIDELFTPKSVKWIQPGTLIATAGSCFAQNIRNEIISRGYQYLDVEPPPDKLPLESAKNFGFSIFSARFGNIYTVAQLLQLVYRALGMMDYREYWVERGRYFDPVRPTIEPNGFSSIRELELDRKQHNAAVRKLFEKADVFIFTLGLTEAWISKINGIVYPMCPGTAAGTFDSDMCFFKNFRLNEILTDFSQFRELVMKFNPKIKFILTVSPVPLVATAEKHHVIYSNTYSKSVLRTAAGELFQTFDNVDYFPSYEIFTSPNFRSVYYESDIRSPSRRGIEKAMNLFFKSYPQEESPNMAENVVVSNLRKEKESAEQFTIQQQEICDEMLLEEELDED